MQNENSDHSLYLRNITQAVEQSSTALNLKIFVRPPKGLQLPTNTILQVIKPLYGIPEAGNHWYYTYQQHYIEKLEISKSTYDPCLLHTNSIGFGVVGSQTDDTFFIADQKFAIQEQKKLNEAKFAAKDREVLTVSSSLKFNGGLISLTENVISLTQAAKVSNPTEDDAKAFNKRLQWQVNNSTRGLKFVLLERDSLKLVVLTDSSFANNSDFSSQIGYVITLMDKNNNANILH
ncbi:hypothetical protein K3495_g2676 [Podosphaera aphanis]|nr:hypothetical protein K3495_g2676 [Podosphaera aphanis]